MKRLIIIFLVAALLLLCGSLANSYWPIFPVSAPGSEEGVEENPDKEAEEEPNPEPEEEPDEPAAPEEFSPHRYL